jgi:DNA-binding XRE family transcriptional regulator
VHALPNCQLRLKALIPKLTPYFLKTTRYPTTLRHVGDHLRRRRLELGLRQEEVAEQLGVDRTTYVLWEILRTQPTASMRSTVVEFLGYDPFH